MFASWSARAVGLHMTAEDALEVAAEAGFAGVDLLVRDVVEAGTSLPQLRSRMEDLGLRGGAWPLPVQWKADAERFQSDLRALPRYTRAAELLGLTRTGTWVMPEADPTRLESPAPAGMVRERIAELHADRLGRIAQILDDHGIRFGLEIMGPASARSGQHEPFVQKYSELQTLLGHVRLGHPNVGILADAFHLFAAGESVSGAWVWGRDAIVWVHVADPVHVNLPRLRDEERGLPGSTGLGECRALLRQLQIDGYGGPVTAEPLGLPAELSSLPPSMIAKRTLEAIQSVWPVSAGTNPLPGP